MKSEAFIQEFISIMNWEDRYKKLIDMGKNLKAMPVDLKIDSNKVKGCQSQVWLYARFIDGKVHFEADSDASISKGIVAFLVAIYSGMTPHEILTYPLHFLDATGLKENLSLNRANGLSSMIKQIKLYALAFEHKEQMEKK